jgi:hypothetical protein
MQTNEILAEAGEAAQVNRPVEATYYSLVATADHVLLVARWMDDFSTGATMWTELDREPMLGNDVIGRDDAYIRISLRNRHLLSIGEQGYFAAAA